MTERERMIKLIDNSPAMFCTGCTECPEARAKSIEMLADYLIEQGYRKASHVAAEIFAEIDNALHDMAMEYVKAERKDYFAVCEMVHHKVIRPIEKKHTEATE